MKQNLSISTWLLFIIAWVCLFIHVGCGPVRTLHREWVHVTTDTVDSVVEAHALPPLGTWSRFDLKLNDGRPCRTLYYVKPNSRTVYTIECVDTSIMFFIRAEKETK